MSSLYPGLPFGMIPMSRESYWLAPSIGKLSWFEFQINQDLPCFLKFYPFLDIRIQSLILLA